MREWIVEKPDGSKCVITLLPHKENGKFSFVNLTKEHICSCQFATHEDAIVDMELRKSKGLIKDYYEVLTKEVIRR